MTGFFMMITLFSFAVAATTVAAIIDTLFIEPKKNEQENHWRENFYGYYIVAIFLWSFLVFNFEHAMTFFLLLFICIYITSKICPKSTFTIAFNKATLVKETNSLLPILLIVWLVRFFIIQPYIVPTGSLEPTISSGDFILVNQFKYGLRVPVIHNKILEVDKPERGKLFF